MRKMLVIMGVIMAVLLFAETGPVFANDEAIHNTVGAGLEIKNLEAPIEKLAPINFPKWLSLNGEFKKAIATNVGYSDSLAYIEDDKGLEGWLFLTVDLNTEK